MKFQKGLNGQAVKFPLTKAQMKTLDLRGVVNPRPGSNEFKIPAPPKGAALKKAMLEVQECRDVVARDQWPTKLFEDWGIDPKPPRALRSQIGSPPSSTRAALLVEMDRVVDVALLWLTWNARQKEPMRFRFKSEKFIDFLAEVPGVERQIINNIADAFEPAFNAKYYFGDIRPENYFAVAGFARNVTAYKNGAPPHPEYPAGHGCDFGASAATIDMNYEGTARQRGRMIDTFLMCAVFRTIAGVHKMVANIVGFILGWASTKKITYKEARAELLDARPEVKW